MATTIEYALLAGASYRDTRADLNRFPMPSDWSVVSIVSQDNSTGFEASAYRNSNTNEIVISYAGTNPNDGILPPGPDNTANVGLGTGFGSVQLLQAAEYYLQVQAANPTANITFTGHSLGGGLAALMGVFFGKRAVTFDQAPFANSAELNVLIPDVAANLKTDLLAGGYSEALDDAANNPRYRNSLERSAHEQPTFVVAASQSNLPGSDHGSEHERASNNYIYMERRSAAA